MIQEDYTRKPKRNPGKLLTPQEAAWLKKVSRSTIYSAIAEGRLPATRVLGRIAIQEADLKAWMPIPHAGRKKGFAVSPQAKTRMSQARSRWWKDKQERQQR